MIVYNPAHLFTALTHVFRALGAVPKTPSMNFSILPDPRSKIQAPGETLS